MRNGTLLALVRKQGQIAADVVVVQQRQLAAAQLHKQAGDVEQEFG